MRTVLYVCTGNTCRSPMAEAIARYWLRRQFPAEAEEVFVASAGVHAADGAVPTAEAVQALDTLGIDLEGTSTRLTPEMIQNADFVFCMTAGHLEAARAMVNDDPAGQAKVRLLQPDGDVEDPIGMGQDAYDALAQTLTELIPRQLREALDIVNPTNERPAIALGGDHRGAAAIGVLAEHLGRRGWQVELLGDCSGEPCDYPDGAFLVGRAVAGGDAECGVLVCGSGNGVCMAANKVPGVRAALALDATMARMSRCHNDSNLLCLSGDRVSPADCLPIVDAFLEAEFEGGRHERRVRKMTAIERGEDPRTITETCGT